VVHTNRAWPYTNDQRKQWETSKATVGTEMADEPIAATVGYDIMNWLVTINYNNSSVRRIQHRSVVKLPKLRELLTIVDNGTTTWQFHILLKKFGNKEDWVSLGGWQLN
jgi:hypothetical protein